MTPKRFSMKTALSFVLGLATMILSPALALADPAQASAGIVAWVTIEPASEAGSSSQMLSIIGHALALKPVKGRYSLEIKRSSKGGISNTRQGGAIDLKPGATTLLSRSGINVGASDTLDIALKIFTKCKSSMRI